LLQYLDQLVVLSSFSAFSVH